MFPVVTGSTQDVQALMAQDKSEQVKTGSGLAYLKFDGRNGEWTSGTDKDDVEGDLLAVNAAGFTHGWTLAVDGKFTNIEVSVFEELPTAPEPQTDKYGTVKTPVQSRGLSGRWYDGESEVEVKFSKSSYGVVQAISKLKDLVSAKAASGSEYFFPVVTLGSTSYTSKANGNTIHTPTLDVAKWINQDGAEEVVEAPGAPQLKERV